MLNLHTLNPQQRQAVEHVHGPLLILAGAGTGKTRVITTRIAWMIRRGIAPDRILAVTFTNKAAREMKQRVLKMIPKRDRSTQDGQGGSRRLSGPTMCTFHSLGVRILRRHIDKLGYKKNFVIYDESEQLSVVKKILGRLTGKGEAPDPKAVLNLLSRHKNGQTKSAGLDKPSVRALAEHVAKHYESALHACNAVDFDDLLVLTLRLFDEHPAVLEDCRQQYQYVMVDEYQDTNGMQFKLLHLLCQNHRNLCVVGDDDQSIYGWRGAEIANLLDLEQFYPEVRVVKLEQNYRSNNTILNAANAVIRHNARRRGKQLWSAHGAGDKITLYEFETDEEEARTVAESIEFARQAHRIPWGDQAILFRTNLQARPLETALRKAGIRYRLVGGQSYFDRREVRDFMAYLKLFLNPHNDVSLLRVANVPARGLSSVTMERLLGASQERHCSVYAAMRHTDVLASLPARARGAVEDFVEFVERTRGALQEEPGSGLPLCLQQWADRFLQEIDYIPDLRRSEKNAETGENRVRNLKELVVSLGQAAAEETSGCPLERLQAFVEDMTLDSEREEDKETSGDLVTLITMHSCKGLEFPHVYVVGIEDGLLPHTRSKEEGTLDEERRLFYVALTRAMRGLTLSYCLGRKKYGETVPCHPSPFLQELPEELIEHGHEKAKQPVTVQGGKDLFSVLRNSLDDA